MKRVFHIVSHFEMGGAERVAVSIAKSETPGIEYHIVEVIRGHSEFTRVMVQELKDEGIHYHRSPFAIPFSFHYLFECMAARLFPLWFFFIFRKFRPDVVHTHTEIPDMGICSFFRLFPRYLKGCKIVRTIHNTHLWTGLEAMGRNVEAFFQRQHANVAISMSVLTNYEKNYGERPPIIYNGVEAVEQQLYDGVEEGKFNILFAGRFEPQKGIGKLVEIISRLKDDKRFLFHIFGDGTLRDNVHALDGMPNVKVRPPLFSLASYLEAFDYLLMPSEFEGLSILSMEASMNRLPVIANDCLGLKDTLPEDWPLKVHGNSIKEYMHLFKNVLPAANREELAGKASAYARMHFSMRYMQRNYESLYFDSKPQKA
ncbi:MAG: glycosyltransferase family 4 protein [Prevotellaceae bacterium]|nr:glycosyltransferase family 4 protein [Prevotellaceae bacterium]MDY6130563.1 glycosyltransferase family 4 protein [Prevotella sp.]